MGSASPHSPKMQSCSEIPKLNDSANIFISSVELG